MKEEKKHLYNLEDLKDYKVDSNDHDIRGWPVKDADHRTIGKVDNLLVNKNAEKVVYVEITVDHSVIEKGHDPYEVRPHSPVREFLTNTGDHHIIIPVEHVTINPDDKHVHTNVLDSRFFCASTSKNLEYEEYATLNKGEKVSGDKPYEVTIVEHYNKSGPGNRRRKMITKRRVDAHTLELIKKNGELIEERSIYEKEEELT